MLLLKFFPANLWNCKKDSEATQLCPTLCNPMDCSLPGSSLHGILQARVLEWVAISFSRGSSQLRDRTGVSHIPGRHFNLWATREAPETAKSITKYTNCPGRDARYKRFRPFHLDRSCTTRHQGSADVTVKELQKSWVAVLNMETPPLLAKGSQGPLYLITTALCVRAKSRQFCPILCDATDCSPPDCSVCGIPQARIPEWVSTTAQEESQNPWEPQKQQWWEVRLVSPPRSMSLNHMFRWGGFGHHLITRLFLRLSKLQSCLNLFLKVEKDHHPLLTS